MRLGVISDIHGNLPALRAVLGAIDAAEIDEIWCLGDVVGYGASPNECVDLVRERCARSLVGNHDLAVLGEIDISSFSPAAAEAARWSRGVLGESQLEYLDGLSPKYEGESIAAYHASPRDPVWEYVLWPEQAGECIELQAARVALVGHSHVALCFRLRTDEEAESAQGAQAAGGQSLDVAADRWLLNPGSVGQPRDGDPRAAWLELDTEKWEAVYHRVEYEIAEAAEAILLAGLPEHLARRLEIGQ